MKIKKSLVAIMAMVILATAVIAVSYEDVTVTYVIPADIAFSTSYAGSCGTSDFACRENDGSYQGTQSQINITQTDGTVCQAAATPAVQFTNDGNTPINITARLTSSQVAGVVLKASEAYAGYESSCNEYNMSNATACVNVTAANFLVLTDDIAASGTSDVYFWCDFSNFNSGAATTGITRTMTLNSTQETA